MEYNIAAKPTIYKGFRFRSRLEARWAVFFDQIGVKWEYEPVSIQTDAGQVTPDFILDAVWSDGGWEMETMVLFEVKPASFEFRTEYGLNIGLRYGQACTQLLLVDRAAESVGYLIAAGDPWASQNNNFEHREGKCMGEVVIDPRSLGDDEGGFERWSEFDSCRFVRGVQYETAIYPVIDAVGFGDFEKEALYARQYDFMHFLPN